MLNHKTVLLFSLATAVFAFITPRAPGASDPTAVHLAGTETITGSKTFTNNTVFSDPTKTLLLGAAAIPNLAGSQVAQGAQLLISSRLNDAKVPFAVVGGLRSASGDRYATAIYPDGHLFTNTYIT